MVKDCKTVWYGCIQYIQKHVGEQSFNTWFKPVVPIKLNGDVLTIQVPSQFFYEWLEEHYVNILRKAIDDQNIIKKDISKYDNADHNVLMGWWSSVEGRPSVKLLGKFSEDFDSILESDKQLYGKLLRLHSLEIFDH